MRCHIARMENVAMIAFGWISTATLLVVLLRAAIAVECMAVRCKKLFPVLTGT
jgi:hypothetical protein